MPSWDQANRGEKLGFVWRNRKKISQIINDYLSLPFFLLIILWPLQIYCMYIPSTFIPLESCYLGGHSGPKERRPRRRGRRWRGWRWAGGGAASACCSRSLQPPASSSRPPSSQPEQHSCSPVKQDLCILEKSRRQHYYVYPEVMQRIIFCIFRVYYFCLTFVILKAAAE